VRAVVLGATGFLGRALADRLAAAGYEVEPIGSAQLDLRAADAAGALARRLGTDAILVVCSALTPPAGATLDGLRANVAMIASVAAALEATPAALCVYVSSDGVYEASDASLTERAPVRPAGYYAVAKYAGELVLQTACAGAQVPLLVLRPVAIFGAGDTHDAYGPNRFARTAREEGRIVLFGEGEELRDHLYVDDFAVYAVSLVERRATGVLNLASGTARSFAEVAAAVAGASPGDVRIEHAQRAMPITHRRFDTAALRAASPEVQQTDFAAALRTLVLSP
jgi:UDP-glucose 4-epimerase